MKIKWFLLLSFSWMMNTYSQNLIPDPGFEDIIDCPKLYEFDKLRHWKQASAKGKVPGNTTQYGLLYHKCGGRVPNTDWGYYDTHSGDGMGSIVSFFIYTKLKEALIKGKSYRISFWIRVGTKKNIGCWWQTYDDKLALFTYKNQPEDTIVGSVRQNPVHVWNIVEPHDSSWIHFEGCFKAPNDDAFIGIGYKNTLLSLDCDNVNSTEEYRPPFLSVTKEFAFRQLPFFIDDVELELAEELTLPTAETTAFICPNDSAFLDVLPFIKKEKNENRVNFLWNTGEKKPKIGIAKAGIYTITLKDACTTSKRNFTVKKRDCYCNLYVPNIFSPNNDTQNDVFKPDFTCVDATISQYELKIYGRWGNTVFETKDTTIGWDGTFNGQKSDSGVYIWTLSYSLKIGKKTENFIEFGDVTIL
jgi:gliding motility-associated-like protein